MTALPVAACSGSESGLGAGERSVRTARCGDGLACVAGVCSRDVGDLADNGTVPDLGTNDAGPVVVSDAAPGADAGPDTDAGPPGMDAGPPGMDAGPPGMDAGPPGMDAGPPGMDAGPPGMDAGPPGMDAGPPDSGPPDSGTVADSGA